MTSETSSTKDRRNDLVKVFADACVESLLHRSDPNSSVDIAVREAEAESTSIATDAGITMGMYRLSSLIENVAAGERTNGNNLRYLLRATGYSGAAADILADGRHLDALCEDIRHQVLRQIGFGESGPMTDEAVLVASALTTALIGVHAARLDGNWRGLITIWSWCGRTLPSGYQPEGYTLLNIADCYMQFGMARLAMTSDTSIQPPHPDALNELVERARIELEGSPQRDAYLRRLRLFMVDAVSQLPPSRLRPGSLHANWLDEVLEHEPDLHSRFQYNLARARFAQNRIPEAIELSIEALQTAPPSDLPYIELCRQQLLMLEQEASSRIDIEEELTNRIQKNLQRDVGEAKSDVQAETKAIVDASQDKISSEIKDSLLRVIEILGVFLAVAGVAVTTVGGIAAGGSVGRAISIYGTGYLTIVSFFIVLRWMVLKPLVLSRKKSLDRFGPDRA